MSDDDKDERITASTFPVAVLKRAVTVAAKQSTVGELASRIGIGRTTLWNFIVNRTTTPHRRNLRKIAVWYHTEGKDAVELADDVVESLCEALLWGIPAERRTSAVKDMVGFINSLHQTHGVAATGSGSGANGPHP